MVHGIGGNNGKDALRYLNALNGSNSTGTTVATTSTSTTKPTIKMTSSDGVQREDLASTLGNISNKVRVNSPAGQGLASAEDVQKGKLVSGYHFNDINSLGGKYDAKLFDLKYTNTDAARVAQGTNYANESVEYATVAAHLQDNKSPFAELFT